MDFAAGLAALPILCPPIALGEIYVKIKQIIKLL